MGDEWRKPVGDEWRKQAFGKVVPRTTFYISLESGECDSSNGKGPNERFVIFGTGAILVSVTRAILVLTTRAILVLATRAILELTSRERFMLLSWLMEMMEVHNHHRRPSRP